MIRQRFTIAFALAAATIAGCTTGASTTRNAATRSVEYTMSIPDVAAEQFRVEATIRGIPDDTIVFNFPVWAPGAYDIVNFGRFVDELAARTPDGRMLYATRRDTNSFVIASGGAPEIRLTYMVDDIESVPNSTWFGLSDIERNIAFANATALFGYPADYKSIAYSVTYAPPAGWDVAVALDRASDDDAHTYVADDYDELVDAPVMMGRFQRFDFAVAGVPHIITVSAPELIGDTAADELIDRTRTIVEAMSELFGEIPYERYLFQHFLVDPRRAMGRSGWGALEHANSSTYRMPFFSQASVARSLQAVIAHEYWHLWSPKRFHVHELGPFDYQKGPETTSLWFAEGLTEYYARVFLSRLGLSAPEDFMGEMQRDLAGLYRRPQHEPMTELSRRIVHAPLTELVDLYKKGPLLGFLLDAEIRWQTRNGRSLDDAMRHFNEEYGRKGRTFGDEEIIPIIERATGATLADFYRRYIAGRDTLPFDEGFAHAGLRYVVRDTLRYGLGAALEPARDGARVVTVFDGGSAQVAGVMPGDILQSLDFEGYSIPLASVPLGYIDELFADTLQGNAGDGAPRFGVRSLSISRDGQPIKLVAAVRPSPATIARLEADPAAGALALEIRRSMLGF